MSYRTEQAEKRAAKAKRSKRFVYKPVGMDRWDGPGARERLGPILAKGDVVVKVQPHGCPRNGTMGQCYVGHPETGDFIGMVNLASLQPTRK